MDPLDFLAVVLPSPGEGLYCVAELSTARKAHTFSETLEGLLPSVKRWDAANRDIFFALSVFEEAGKRTADNALTIRALFLDLDGYATKKDAAATLDGFLETTGLAQFGSPWLVSSGGGLHAYWPLTESVAIPVWKQTAENLKRLCAHAGMKIDMSVTADAARVLRFPGTRNHKAKYPKPRPVQLLHHGDIFNFDSLAAHVASKLPAEAAAPRTEAIPGTRPKREPSAERMKLLENSVTHFAPIMERSEQGTGCGQLKAYLDRPQEDGLEPVWRGLLSWTKVCADGDEYAVKLSEMHPYSKERMQQKLRAIKGPYPCSKMDSENPGVCTACPHWQKITNPLVFGHGILKDNTEKLIELAPASVTDDDVEAELGYEEETPEEAEVDAIPVASILRPKPPAGFSYGAKGGVYVEKEDKDAQGNKIKREVQIIPYDLFVVDVLRQENDCVVHIVANRPSGVQSFVMPQRAIASKDDTTKFMASQNIIASFGKNNDENLYNYVRACVAEASLRKPIEVPIQCGWQKNGSFVYNYRVFRPDGTEHAIPMPGLENINRNTTPKGNIDSWRKLLKVLIAKEMYTMLALVVDSFGSPLMRFTEYEGFVWHIGARNSGTGKSLTLSLKAGVWGHPIHYRTGKSTSPVAMQQRAGLLNSMPLLIDEVTSTQRANMEWAPAFIFDITEGQGKERMEAGSNKERINNSTWALTCTMTSNTNLTDYMSGARQHSSQGEMLRMLEWNPNEKLRWTQSEREALNGIKQNYGVAGELWVRWLVSHQAQVQEMVRRVHEKLQQELSFSDDERYWHSGCTVIAAAAILLGSKYANIIDLPVTALIDALREIVNKARGSLTSSVLTAEDVLNAYTRDYYGNFIVLRRAEGKLLTAWGDGETIDKSLTRSKVLGRVEHGMSGPGWVDYFIEEQLLKRHCVAMSFGYDEFKDQLQRQFSMIAIKKDMLAKTNGPHMRVNALHLRRQEDEPRVD